MQPQVRTETKYIRINDNKEAEAWAEALRRVENTNPDKLHPLMVEIRSVKEQLYRPTTQAGAGAYGVGWRD